MNGRRSGRIELASLAAGMAGGAVVAVVVWMGLPERESQAVPPPAASDPRITELVSALGRLEQKIDALERAPRPREATSERAPVPQPEGEADPVPLTATQELHEDLRALESRLDVLTMAWKEHDKPTFELPTLEQVHAARRDVDWKWVGELAELYRKDENAALEQVRLMTFDQLLKRVGVPSAIKHDDGSWMYLSPESDGAPWRGLYFGFVGDCVSWVRTIK